MRLIKCLPVIAGLALVACGDSGSADTDGDGSVSAEEMAAEVAREGGAVKPQPGNYRVTMTVQRADIPGMPPEMMEMMGSAMNNTFEYCLTAEEAERGYEETLTEGQDDSCTMERFDMDGGNIEMAMSCASPDGGSMSMTMNGNVTPTRAEMNVVTRGNMTGTGEANIEMTMLQERIGDCAS